MIPAAAGSGIAAGPLFAEYFPPETAVDVPQEEFRFLTPPIIQWTTPESFEVLAITSHRAECSVRVREKGSGGEYLTVTNQEHGLVKAYETYHQLTVPGLFPDKKYEYRLQARQILDFEPYKVDFGPTLETPTRIVTLPSGRESELNLSVLNDLHKNIPLIHSLMEKIESAPDLPRFVLLNGDILSHIEGEADVAAILNLPGRYASEHPLVWIRGNHECRGNFARYMTRYLTMPDGRYYYTFRRGPVQFLVLDNGEDKNDNDPAYCGLTDFDTYRAREEEWFSRVIESPEWKEAPYRILVSHIPVGHIPGDEDRDPKFFPEYKKRWGDIMNRAGLDLEISAHYHKFYLEEPSGQRSFPVVIGGGPDRDSAVIVNVYATGQALGLDVTNLQGEKIGERKWERKERNA